MRTILLLLLLAGTCSAQLTATRTNDMSVAEYNLWKADRIASAAHLAEREQALQKAAIADARIDRLERQVTALASLCLTIGPHTAALTNAVQAITKP